jgi:hypothetical protein
LKLHATEVGGFYITSPALVRPKLKHHAAEAGGIEFLYDLRSVGFPTFEAKSLATHRFMK